MKNSVTKKIRLGVVGTGFVVPKFIDGAIRSGYFSLEAIVSRKVSTGKKFKKENGYFDDVKVFNTVEEMLASSNVDVVYIATPNAIHLSQALYCLERKKALIIEKPIASNAKETRQMVEKAKENSLLMEGMKVLFCPNFQVLVENLPRVGKIHQCSATYAKQSDRYESYLRGENPNTFNLSLSNGSIMDLGTYCVYPFVSLFGKPQSITAFGSLLESGVDSGGVAILQYPDFPVTIQHSKIANTYNKTEIIGEKGTLTINFISFISDVEFVHLDGTVEKLGVIQDKNPLFYIAKHYGKLYADGMKESPVNTHQLSLEVMEVLDEIRKQMGVKFPADS